jgi:hypothetical protein
VPQAIFLARVCPLPSATLNADHPHPTELLSLCKQCPELDPAPENVACIMKAFMELEAWRTILSSRRCGKAPGEQVWSGSTLTGSGSDRTFIRERRCLGSRPAALFRAARSRPSLAGVRNGIGWIVVRAAGQPCSGREKSTGWKIDLAHYVKSSPSTKKLFGKEDSFDFRSNEVP